MRRSRRNAGNSAVEANAWSLFRRGRRQKSPSIASFLMAVNQCKLDGESRLEVSSRGRVGLKFVVSVSVERGEGAEARLE